MQLSLEAQIESILFFKGEAVSIQQLSKMLDVTIEEIDTAVGNLHTLLVNRGLVLIQNENEVTLSTHPEMSGLIESIVKDELRKDLSKAALETLSIVVYRGPIKRSEIDYIRGVNSQFILRNLSVRGLILKKQDPQDERAYLYSPSMELLQYIGILKQTDMPDYSSVQEELKVFIENQEKNEKEN